MVKWVVRTLVAILTLYVVLFASVGVAMLQPPQSFGRFMRHMPAAVVWGLLPAPTMWGWARQGDLKQGEPAPDFTLVTQGQSEQVTLSSHRGRRPVLLVFGSYT